MILAAIGAAAALPNPAALFTFDGAGGQVADVTTGETFPFSATVQIKSGGASGNYLAFSRNDASYVALGRKFAFRGDYSISFWMRTAPGYREGGSMLLSRHAAGSYNGLWFMVNSEWGYGQPDKLTFYYSNATVVSRTSVNDGRWHHVGLVHRASGVELYIDGKLEAKGGPASETIPDVDFVLGAITWDRPHGNFAGDLDEVALFKAALGDAEVAALAAAPAYFSAWQTAGSSFLPPGAAAGGDAVMIITLKNGQKLALPVADIANINFQAGK
jgi:hypothetical protein